MEPHTVPALSRFLANVLPYPLIALLAFNMVQRRFLAVGEGKRFATLYLAGLLVLLFGAAHTFAHFRVADVFLALPAAIIGLVAWRVRARIWPFRLRCPGCNARLPARRVLFYDDHRCETCAPQDNPPSEDQA